MREDKIRKNKIVHKTLCSQGFREPYQILVDYSFAKAMNKTQLGLGNIETMLRGTCKLFIPKCEYERYKKYKKEKDLTGQCEIIKCKHEEDNIDCLLNIIREDNRHHYLLATSDSRLGPRTKDIKKLPLIKTKNSAIFVDLGGMKRIKIENQGVPAKKKELKQLKKMFGDVSE